MKKGIIAAFRGRLPLPPSAPNISLGEGNTPLLPLTLGEKYGIQIHAKVEGANPTGSFKDRGMAVAVASAKAEGARAVVCASTGNTSSSAAAYAARAGMVCVVLLPEGKVAAGKTAQTVAHGARIIRVRGNFDEAMAAVREFSGGGVAIVNSTNPMRLQGQKTAAFEVCEQLGKTPDYHSLPVGNAGNITAHWIGYCETAARGFSHCSHCDGKCPFAAKEKPPQKPPVMLGFQAAGAAPFVRGAPVKNPETVATAIRIGNPQSFAAANAAVSESGGRIGELGDEEILAAQKTLAQKEGIFCEPASAASVAGVLKEAAAGNFPRGAQIVCTLTGHGLKDPDVIRGEAAAEAGPEKESLRAAMQKVINGG